MSLYMFQKIETGLILKAWVQIVSFVDRFHESEKAFAKAQQEFVLDSKRVVLQTKPLKLSEPDIS